MPFEDWFQQNWGSAPSSTGYQPPNWNTYDYMAAEAERERLALEQAQAETRQALAARVGYLNEAGQIVDTQSRPDAVWDRGPLDTMMRGFFSGLSTDPAGQLNPLGSRDMTFEPEGMAGGINEFAGNLGDVWSTFGADPKMWGLDKPLVQSGMELWDKGVKGLAEMPDVPDDYMPGVVPGAFIRPLQNMARQSEIRRKAEEAAAASEMEAAEFQSLIAQHEAKERSAMGGAAMHGLAMFEALPGFATQPTVATEELKQKGWPSPLAKAVGIPWGVARGSVPMIEGAAGAGMSLAGGALETVGISTPLKRWARDIELGREWLGEEFGKTVSPYNPNAAEMFTFMADFVDLAVPAAWTMRGPKEVAKLLHKSGKVSSMDEAIRIAQKMHDNRMLRPVSENPYVKAVVNPVGSGIEVAKDLGWRAVRPLVARSANAKLAGYERRQPFIDMAEGDVNMETVYDISEPPPIIETGVMPYDAHPGTFAHPEMRPPEPPPAGGGGLPAPIRDERPGPWLHPEYRAPGTEPTQLPAGGGPPLQLGQGDIAAVGEGFTMRHEGTMSEQALHQQQLDKANAQLDAWMARKGGAEETQRAAQGGVAGLMGLWFERDSHLERLGRGKEVRVPTQMQPAPKGIRNKLETFKQTSASVQHDPAQGAVLVQQISDNIKFSISHGTSYSEIVLAEANAAGKNMSDAALSMVLDSLPPGRDLYSGGGGTLNKSGKHKMESLARKKRATWEAENQRYRVLRKEEWGGETITEFKDGSDLENAYAPGSTYNRRRKLWRAPDAKWNKTTGQYDIPKKAHVADAKAIADGAPGDIKSVEAEVFGLGDDAAALERLRANKAARSGVRETVLPSPVSKKVARALSQAAEANEVEAVEALGQKLLESRIEDALASGRKGDIPKIEKTHEMMMGQMRTRAASDELNALTGEYAHNDIVKDGVDIPAEELAAHNGDAELAEQTVRGRVAAGRGGDSLDVPQGSYPLEARSPNAAGRAPTHYGNADASVKVDMDYEFIDLDDVKTSHDHKSGDVNPLYEQDRQPRLDRGTSDDSKMQRARLVNNFEPGLALKKPATVGPEGENFVEIGNGSTNALRELRDRALAGDPDAMRRWETYQNLVKADAKVLGKDVSGMHQPVKFQRRRSRMTPTERRAYIEDSNNPSSLGHTDHETGKMDAGKLSPSILDEIQKAPDEKLRVALGRVGNSNAWRDFKKYVIKALAPELETKGRPNPKGVNRVVAAIMARVFDGPNGADVVPRLGSEQLDLGNIRQALEDTSLELAKVKERVAAGQLDTALDISEDLAEGAHAVAVARAEGNSVVDHWFSQRTMFAEGDLTDAGKIALAHFALNANSAPKMRRGLERYIELAQGEPVANQTNLFGEALRGGTGLSKESMMAVAFMPENKTLAQHMANKAAKGQTDAELVNEFVGGSHRELLRRQNAKAKKGKGKKLKSPAAVGAVAGAMTVEDPEERALFVGAMMAAGLSYPLIRDLLKAQKLNRAARAEELAGRIASQVEPGMDKSSLAAWIKKAAGGVSDELAGHAAERILAADGRSASGFNVKKAMAAEGAKPSQVDRQIDTINSMEGRDPRKSPAEQLAGETHGPGDAPPDAPGVPADGAAEARGPSAQRLEDYDKEINPTFSTAYPTNYITPLSTDLERFPEGMTSVEGMRMAEDQGRIAQLTFERGGNPAGTAIGFDPDMPGLNDISAALEGTAQHRRWKKDGTIAAIIEHQGDRAPAELKLEKYIPDPKERAAALADPVIRRAVRQYNRIMDVEAHMTGLPLDKRIDRGYFRHFIDTEAMREGLTDELIALRKEPQTADTRKAIDTLEQEIIRLKSRHGKFAGAHEVDVPTEIYYGNHSHRTKNVPHYIVDFDKHSAIFSGQAGRKVGLDRNLPMIQKAALQVGVGIPGEQARLLRARGDIMRAIKKLTKDKPQGYEALVKNLKQQASKLWQEHRGWEIKKKVNHFVTTELGTGKKVKITVGMQDALDNYLTNAIGGSKPSKTKDVWLKAIAGDMLGIENKVHAEELQATLKLIGYKVLLDLNPAFLWNRAQSLHVGPAYLGERYWMAGKMRVMKDWASRRLKLGKRDPIVKAALEELGMGLLDETPYMDNQGGMLVGRMLRKLSSVQVFTRSELGNHLDIITGEYLRFRDLAGDLEKLKKSIKGPVSVDRLVAEAVRRRVGHGKGMLGSLKDIFAPQFLADRFLDEPAQLRAAAGAMLNNTVHQSALHSGWKAAKTSIFHYGRSERALGTITHPWTDLALQFQSFTAKQMQFFGRRLTKKGKVKMMMYPFAIGGPLTMPFVGWMTDNPLTGAWVKDWISDLEDSPSQLTRTMFRLNLLRSLGLTVASMASPTGKFTPSPFMLPIPDRFTRADTEAGRTLTGISKLAGPMVNTVANAVIPAAEVFWVTQDLAIGADATAKAVPKMAPVMRNLQFAYNEYAKKQQKSIPQAIVDSPDKWIAALLGVRDESIEKQFDVAGAIQRLQSNESLRRRYTLAFLSERSSDWAQMADKLGMTEAELAQAKQQAGMPPDVRALSRARLNPEENLDDFYSIWTRRGVRAKQGDESAQFYMDIGTPIYINKLRHARERLLQGRRDPKPEDRKTLDKLDKQLLEVEGIAKKNGWPTEMDTQYKPLRFGPARRFAVLHGYLNAAPARATETELLEWLQGKVPLNLQGLVKGASESYGLLNIRRDIGIGSRAGEVGQYAGGSKRWNAQTGRWE